MARTDDAVPLVAQARRETLGQVDDALRDILDADRLRVDPTIRVIKIGAKTVRPDGYFTFQVAQVGVPRNLFRAILALAYAVPTPSG
jgi:hypothetical protein